MIRKPSVFPMVIPNTGVEYCTGITPREYFAAKFMQAQIEKDGFFGGEIIDTSRRYARAAITAADIFLEELSRE